MRLIRHLKEQTPSIQRGLSDLRLNEILEIIHKECKPFMKEIGGFSMIDDPIFRGVKNIPQSYAIKTGTRDESRLSKYTAQPVSDVFDKVFEKKFGWRWRSKGVFTGSRVVALGYGADVCLFIPMGKYRYVWSDEYNKVWRWLKNEAQWITLSKRDQQKYLEAMEEKAEEAAKVYHNTNLRKAFKNKTSSYEAIFEVKKYLLVAPPYYKDVALRLMK